MPQLISEYSVTKFKEKLNELTKVGSQIVGWHPYRILSSKPFYGYIYESEFRITRNSLFNKVPFIIIGNFKAKGDHTNLNYKIVPQKCRYRMQKIWPFIVNFLLVFILIFTLKNENFGSLDLFSTIFILLFIELLAFFPILTVKLRCKNFERNFLKLLKLRDSVEIQ